MTFYEDREGIVHLKGVASRGAGSSITIFSLPPGYAPNEQHFIAAATLGATPGSVFVETNGDVKFGSGNNAFISLSGVTWRAGG